MNPEDLKEIMSTPPIVICIEYATYVASMAAMTALAEELPDRKERLMTAVADMERAYSQFRMIQLDAMPALLKRQAE